MAVAEKPEAEYILDCCLASLAQIRKANKSKSGNPFFTEVATVGDPDYKWDQFNRIFEEKPAAVLLWVMGFASSQHDFQNRRPFMRATVVGYVEVPLARSTSSPRVEGVVQRAAIRLWDDVDRVMLGNPMKNHPDAPSNAQNVYGVTTAATQVTLPTTLEVQDQMNTMGRAMFASSYDITFRAPL